MGKAGQKAFHSRINRHIHLLPSASCLLPCPKGCKLIGVNGIQAQPLWGDPYVYEDDSKPNDALRERMRRSSWGVSIQTLAQLAPKFAPAVISQGVSTVTKHTPSSTSQVVSQVDKIAKEITVSITWPTSHGSGVIVAKEGNTYYVLTALHVVRGKSTLAIVTPDGQQYPVNISTIKNWDGVDLALLQFTSNQTYQVATLANYNLGYQNKVVFVSRWSESTQATRKPSSHLSAGFLFGDAINNAKDASTFSTGYELIYTSLTEKGMSGSPVLDNLGRVIGIHAAAEGEPSLIEQKAGQKREIQLGNSLGIPIRTFLALVQQEKLNLKTETSLPPQLSDPEQDEIIKSSFNLEPPGSSADEFEWLSFGNTLLRSLKYEKAVEAFDRAIKIQPRFDLALYARGRTLKLQKKYKESLVSLEQAIAYNPNYDPAWREIGATLYYLKRYEESRKALEKVIALKPDEFIGYQWLGIVLGELGNYPKAIKALDQAIKINPLPYQYIVRGNIRVQMGDYEEAIKDLSEALHLDPDNALAYQIRGLVRSHPDQGDYKGALNDINKAINLQSNDPNGYSAQGFVYARMGNRQAFTEDFNKALRLHPDSDDIYSARGNAHTQLQDYKEAIEDYTTAIRLVPESAYKYYTSLGNVRSAQKDYKGAIANYTEAIRLEPNYALAYVARGFVQAQMGNKQGFTENFNKALSLQPDNAWFYIRRGNARFLLKDKQGGIEDYNKAISLAPELTNLYYTLRGIALYHQEDYEGAIADYTEAIRRNPKNAVFYYNRADTYYQQKDYKQALADYTEAIRLKPDYADAYNRRGQTRAKLEDHKGAIEDYNQVLRVLEVSGIGIQPEVNPQTKVLMITKVLENTPAQKGGLKVGDQILAIDGQPTANLSLEKAINLLRGKTGTQVNLRIVHEGKSALNITLTRTSIINLVFPEVYYNRGIAHAQLGEKQGAREDFQKAADLYQQQKNIEQYKIVQKKLSELQQ